LKSEREEDFRNDRARLPDSAFAIVQKPEVEPKLDIVKKEVWNSIVSFPDDVSLRTSDYYGTLLGTVHVLWGSWIESVGAEQDPLSYGMLDAVDELQGAIFNLLNGFYRISADCLRSALEKVVHGLDFQIAGSQGWKEAQTASIQFGKSCDALMGNQAAKGMGEYLASKGIDSVFDQKRPGHAPDGGWARHLHSRSSEFAHGRSEHSRSAMWEGSNGPIFVPKSVGKIFLLYLETLALMFVTVKLGKPSFPLPGNARLLFHSGVNPSKVSTYCYQYLFGGVPP